MADQGDLVAWLLEADPAIRWQALRDLLDAPPAAVAAERARVATTGWGAEILAHQDPDGRWAGGLYRPHWTGTTYSLLELHGLGLPAGNAQALRGVEVLLDAAQRFDGGLTYPDSTARYPEACITSAIVLLAASNGCADPRVEESVAWLLGQRLADGGWNCESIPTASRHSSFHTTISALEALLAYRDAGGPSEVGAALRGGQEFLLEHRLYRSHRTGAVVDEAMTRFPFPPRWRYDVLRGLEHFRAAGADRDERLADAVAVVLGRRAADGRWPADAGLAGPVWVEPERPGPSRWATLRALRVLRWWGTAPGSLRSPDRAPGRPDTGVAAP
jgi:hypothetical protein